MWDSDDFETDLVQGWVVIKAVNVPDWRRSSSPLRLDVPKSPECSREQFSGPRVFNGLLPPSEVPPPVGPRGHEGPHDSFIFSYPTWVQTKDTGGRHDYLRWCPTTPTPIPHPRPTQ